MSVSRAKGMGLVLLISLALVTICCAFEENPQQSPVSGCSGTGNVREQLIGLSKLLDASGKLSKLIAEFNSSQEQARGAEVTAESDQIKRSTESEQAGSDLAVAASENQPVSVATTTELPSSPAPSASTQEPGSSTIAPAITPATSASAPSEPSNTTATIVQSASSTAVSEQQASTTVVPITTKSTESSNVTVNVFLQLAPDAKTEDIINNPDRAISNSPSSTTSSPTPSASSEQPNSTVPSSTVASPATSKSTETTTLAPASSPAPIETAAPSPTAATGSTTAASRRRRRRWAGASAAPAVSPPSQAPSVTPAAPASSTSTPTTSTTTTTTAEPSTSAPASTTTTTSTTAPAQASTTVAATSAAPSSTTSTSTSTTTTTTTTTPAPAPATTAEAVSKVTVISASPSTSEPVTVAASKPASTAAPTVVEISVKDLPAERRADSSLQTTEIVISSVANSPSSEPAAPESNATAAPAAVPAPVASPAEPAPAQAAAPAPVPVPAPAPAQPAQSTPTPTSSTPSTPAAAATPTTSTTTTTTTAAPSSTQAASTSAPSTSKAAPAGTIKMTSERKEKKENEETSAPDCQLSVSQLEQQQQQQQSKQQQLPVNDKSKIGEEKEAYEKVEQLLQLKSAPGAEVSSPQSLKPTVVATPTLDTNVNVIYDNDDDNNNNNNHSNNNNQNEDGRGSNETRRSNHNEDTSNQAKTTSSKMSDFVNFDRVEAENGGYERENYATCLVEGSPNDSSLVKDQTGRLNFWQPIHNRGVMHLVAHYSYRLQTATKLRRRESFRAPIERAPSDNPMAMDKLIRSNHLERDQIWLVESCEHNFTAILDSVDQDMAAGYGKSLLAELTRQQVDPDKVEVDSELIVGQFNLTGLNEIANKHLLLFRRQEDKRTARIACCKVTQTDTMPASDLPDHANKTSIIQATRN